MILLITSGISAAANERFIETVRRTGLDPFKLGVYGEAAVTERKQNA